MGNLCWPAINPKSQAETLHYRGFEVRISLADMLWEVLNTVEPRFVWVEPQS